ncbi:hypothetical protein [Planctomonas psychrotolerans]|uniref:hypothetical protein n=1 Tax=Planctomonas psychrotolerans TaxID=2528712 RepID=UPI00123A78C5|nr:hypothetical protein [Planctomonas psychrotolerans]
MTNDDRINSDLGAEIVPEYDPASERDTEGKQDEPRTSETLDDPEVESEDVQVLPGTGGPDDVGEVEVDPSELNMSGDSIPGHPKPEAGR